MRFYLSSRSYPELREHPAGAWARGLVWLRAARSAASDRAFWWFLATQVGLVFGGLALSRMVFAIMFEDRRTPTGFRAAEWYELAIPMAISWAAIILAGLIAASWGGDVLRPHLRAVDEHARTACPDCGHDLADRVDWPVEAVGCPECGASVPSSLFRPPHRIPRRFLAFGRREPR